MNFEDFEQNAEYSRQIAYKILESLDEQHVSIDVSLTSLSMALASLWLAGHRPKYPLMSLVEHTFDVMLKLKNEESI